MTKKNNLLSPPSYRVNTKYAANHYSLIWPNKIVGEKLFDFIGTQIYNL